MKNGKRRKNEEVKRRNYESRTKTVINKISFDLRANAPGLMLCACFIIIMELIFGMVCPLRIFAGIPCPGCGMTRALVLLLKGDAAGSIRMQPMLLPVLAGTVLFLCERYCFANWKKAVQIYGIICLTAAVALYLLRMVILFPYSPPMLYDSRNLVHYLIELAALY